MALKVLSNDLEQYEQACTAALRGSGARVTKPRLAVIHCLATAIRPLTARELFEELQRTNEVRGVDQVSIYRILEALRELGLVHQVFPSGGFLPCFHHSCTSQLHVLIRCSQCERIEELDVPQETLAPIIWYLKNNKGFQPDEHLFQMNGLCQQCGPAAVE
jgi:Fur family ferric uptake transcriptional regulator